MNIQEFTYEPARNIRATTDDKGNPLFMAKDVCEVLGLENSRQAVSRLDEEDRITVIFNDGNKGNPERTFITESGLYNLIFSSTKPEAKAFKKWVTSVLLPTVRKTGSYNMADNKVRKNLLPEVQVHNARLANNTNFRRGGVQTVKFHNTEVEKAITGKSPKEWREIGKAKGYPSKVYSSGKQVIRQERPAEACCISTADDLVREGYSTEQAIEAARAFKDGFAKLISMGYVPAELAA